MNISRTKRTFNILKEDFRNCLGPKIRPLKSPIISTKPAFRLYILLNMGYKFFQIVNKGVKFIRGLVFSDRYSETAHFLKLFFEISNTRHSF